MVCECEGAVLHGRCMSSSSLEATDRKYRKHLWLISGYEGTTGGVRTAELLLSVVPLAAQQMMRYGTEMSRGIPIILSMGGSRGGEVPRIKSRWGFEEEGVVDRGNDLR